MTMHSNRRTFMKGAAGAALALGAPAIVGRPAKAAQELVFVGFGGAYQEGQAKALFQPFERETGIKIVQTTGVELAKLRAQVQSKNVEWDLICLPDRLRPAAVKDGLLEKIDYGRLDKSDILADTVSDYCVGAITLANQITYSKQVFPDAAPTTWADVWNTQKFPGRRGIYGAVTYTLEFALLADGVPKDKLYPLDVDRAGGCAHHRPDAAHASPRQGLQVHRRLSRRTRRSGPRCAEIRFRLAACI